MSVLGREADEKTILQAKCAQMDSPAARWITNDALKELQKTP